MTSACTRPPARSQRFAFAWRLALLGSTTDPRVHFRERTYQALRQQASLFVWSLSLASSPPLWNELKSIKQCSWTRCTELISLNESAVFLLKIVFKKSNLLLFKCEGFTHPWEACTWNLLSTCVVRITACVIVFVRLRYLVRTFNVIERLATVLNCRFGDALVNLESFSRIIYRPFSCYSSLWLTKNLYDLKIIQINRKIYFSRM